MQISGNSGTRSVATRGIYQYTRPLGLRTRRTVSGPKPVMGGSAENLLGKGVNRMEESKPTHLDYTTVYGSARAVSAADLGSGLPLSRLLSLSQFIEAIVLLESLTFELGTSELWRPYADALMNSVLMGFLNREKWIRPLPEIGRAHV